MVLIFVFSWFYLIIKLIYGLYIFNSYTSYYLQQEGEYLCTVVAAPENVNLKWTGVLQIYY